jgi:hypothetical protein
MEETDQSSSDCLLLLLCWCCMCICITCMLAAARGDRGEGGGRVAVLAVERARDDSSVLERDSAGGSRGRD